MGRPSVTTGDLRRTCSFAWLRRAHPDAYRRLVVSIRDYGPGIDGVYTIPEIHGCYRLVIGAVVFVDVPHEVARLLVQVAPLPCLPALFTLDEPSPGPELPGAVVSRVHELHEGTRRCPHCLPGVA